jgi:Flp pilus assembly protein TadG
MIASALIPGRRFAASEKGATAAEMAVVLMAVVVLILGTIEFAVAYWSLHSALLAVEEVGRYVMVYNPTSSTPCDTNCAQTRMRQYLTAASTCTYSQATAPTAGQYCVNACSPPTSGCPSTGTVATMTLTAGYGFNFIGLYTPKLVSQVTVPLD